MGLTTSICQSIRLGYFPVLAVLLLLGSTIPVPGASQGSLDGSDNGLAAAQEDSALRVTKSDYLRDVSQIFGEHAFAYVVLEDPRWSEPDVRSNVAVEISSETDSDGVVIDLLETGIDTGVFYGGFGFSKSGSENPHAHPVLGRIGVNDAGESQNARIHVGDEPAGEMIHLRTQGGSPSHNATIQWFDSVSATITVTNQFNRIVPLTQDDLSDSGGSLVPIVGYGEKFNIVIEDPDLNRDPNRVEQYHDLLRAYSDSQPEGEALILTEVGGSDSGRFHATLEFEPGFNAGNRHLFVQHGDRIHLEYREPHTPRGVEEIHRLPEGRFASGSGGPIWYFEEAADGSIRTERSIYFGETHEGNLHGDDRAVIIIDDPGERHRNGSAAGEIVVEVESAQGKHSRNITATQLGSQSSLFIATLGFTTENGAANLDKEVPLLSVGDPSKGIFKDTITVRYTDRDENNISRIRSHSFAWSQIETASIQVGGEDDLFFGTQQDIMVRVEDLDSSTNPNVRDTIMVHAKSTSDAINGLNVPLLETGLNTGVFTGSFRFTTGPTGNEALRVSDGDQVVVEYRDRLTEDGSSQIVRSDPVYWKAPTQAVIRTDLTDYYADFDNGGEFNTYAIVSVQDRDRSHPLQRNQIQATAVAVATDVQPQDIPLLEIGTDTGHFVGLLSLSSFLGDNLGATAGHAEFQLQYREPLPGGGTRLVETDLLRLWDAPEGDDVIIRFEHIMAITSPHDTSHPRWAYPKDRIFMPSSDANDPRRDITVAFYGSGEGFSDWVVNPDESDTLGVRVKSDSCGEEDSVDLLLTQEGESNRFISNITLETEGSCGEGNILGVDQVGDTVTIEVRRVDGVTVLSYEAETRASQGEQIRFVESDSESGLLPRTAGLNNPVDILLDRGNHGKYSGTQLFVETHVWSRENGEPIIALLAETGNDSGEFRGAVGFTHSRAEAGSVSGKVLVREDADTFPQSGTPQYGLYDGIVAGEYLENEAGDFAGTERAATLWFPIADAELEVTKSAFGSGSFELRLVDGDGTPHRDPEIHEGDEGQTVFDFENRYVPGSEHVFVHRTELKSRFNSDEITVDAGQAPEGRGPAEIFADRERTGIVDCGDVVIVHTPNSNHRCTELDSGDGRITLSGSGSGIVSVSYMYRASLAPNNVCPSAPSPVSSDNGVESDGVDDTRMYQYVRTATGIRLCAAPENEGDGILDDDIILEFDYQNRDRTIVVRGPTETEEVTLTYSASLSNARTDGKSVFTGEIQVEAFQVSENERIHVPDDRTQIGFYYLDPAQEADGQPGSLTVGHFRSNPVEAVWRDAQTAQIEVMTHDFSEGAGDFVYGPGVSVEVRDIDSSRFDRRDTIVVEASGNNNMTQVMLRETGRDTGVFRGVVPAANLMDGQPGSITVTYRDPQNSLGVPSLRSTVTDWRPATTANVTVEGQGFRGPLASFDVRITDTDANRDSNRIERIDARVVSDSDPVGEPIRLQETGPNTGEFVASAIRFEKVHNPGSGRVFVQDGDAFWVTYVDPLTKIGIQQVLDSERHHWFDANDGVVAFDRSFQIGTDAGSPGDAPVGLEKLARAGVTITDRDRSTNATRINVIAFEGGSVVVGEDEDEEDLEAHIEIGAVQSDGSIAAGIDKITFVETGHNTGEFIAVFSFIDEEFAGDQGLVPVQEEDLSEGFARVPVQPGDRVRVTYTDPDPLDAIGSGSFDDEAQWFLEGFGVVRFDRKGYGDFDQEPRVTVYDAHAPPVGVDVVVSSNADAGGIGVTLEPRGDAPGGGIYTSTFRLSPTPSVRALFVHTEDQLEVRYADASFSRTATHTALFIEGLNDPPVTTMVTDPPFPDGDNGWFITQPTVSLETDRSAQHIEVTHFRRDGGPIQEYDGPMTLGQGIHVFEYWSVDLIGNVEEQKTRTIHVSLIDPVAQVADFEATSRPEGRIELTWAGVPGKLNPMEFGEYRIFRDSLRNQVGATDTESFIDLPPEDGNYTYFIYVANAAGRHNEDLAVSAQGVSDRVPPVVESFEVTPRELHDDLGEDTVTANLTVTADTLHDVDRVFLRVIDPFGEIRHEVPMEQGATERDWQLRYSGFNISGMYHIFGVAADLAGNEGTGDHTVRFFAEDREAPRIVSIPDELEFEHDLNVTVRDNDRGVARIAYSVEGGPFVEVPIPDQAPGADHCMPGPCEVNFAIPAQALGLGHNVIEFQLGDANEPPNEATVNHTVFVALPREDVTPPGAPEITLQRSLVEYGKPLRLTVQSETPLRVIERDLDDGLSERLIQRLDFETGALQIPLDDFDPGEHTIRVRAANEAGPVVKEFTFYLLDEGVPLPPERVSVSFDNRGRPVIEWSASPSDPSMVGGYLVHRTSSPWTVIEATDADKRAYVDTSAESNKEYRYTVTAYGTNGEGYLEPGTDSSGMGWLEYSDVQTVQTNSIQAITTVLLWVALILLGVFVLLAIVYVNRGRIFGAMQRREGDTYIGADTPHDDPEDVQLLSSPYETGDKAGDSDPPYPDEDWGSTAGAGTGAAQATLAQPSETEASGGFGDDRHKIRCPGCSNVFHVTGQLPVVAACPSCGGKGILR